MVERRNKHCTPLLFNSFPTSKKVRVNTSNTIFPSVFFETTPTIEIIDTQRNPSPWNPTKSPWNLKPPKKKNVPATWGKCSAVAKTSGVSRGSPAPPGRRWRSSRTSPGGLRPSATSRALATKAAKPTGPVCIRELAMCISQFLDQKWAEMWGNSMGFYGWFYGIETNGEKY